VNELIFFINKVIVSGTVLGCVYALGAVGITLIFGILRFAHFAHGELMTMGAYFSFMFAILFQAWGIQSVLPLGFMVLPFSIVLTLLICLILDRWFYAPLRKQGAKPVSLLIASIGITMMLQGLIRLFGGVKTQSFFSTESKEIFRFAIDGAKRKLVVSEPQVLLICLTLIICISLHLFLTRSKTGKGMRAMSDNPELASLSGIDIHKIVRITWMLAGGLCCIAGTMLALDVSLKPDLAFNIILAVFAAAIVGGLGHPYGAIAGGFLVGFAETLSVFNWSILLRPFSDTLLAGYDIPPQLALVPTEYKLSVAFTIMVVVLLWRPQGIFKGASS